MEDQLKVIIRCLVYNHEPYLRDCLEGFVIQQTNFPFKAVVHDDASTDNSAAIIREYAEKYPHIIEPIYETENQYSKHDGSLGRIMNAATLGRSPYLAYCEGDDYWIDPLKLQKQVDYMDAHPECTMTCSNVEIHTPNGIIADKKQQENWFYSEKSTIIPTNKIIKHAGHTCTLMIKSNLYNQYPISCKTCKVGDYPLQIWAALNGSIYCFKDKTAVYRYESIGSWSANQKIINNKKKAKTDISIINMLNDLNNWSKKKYAQSFEEKIYNYGTRAILLNPKMSKKLCLKYGHIFLKYPIHTQNHYKKSISNILFYILLRIKWFPFKPGNFIKVLKKVSWIQRIRLTYTCLISYFTPKSRH